MNRLFLLSFEKKGDRRGHTGYCLPTVEIKNYNVMVDGSNYFDQPINSDIKTCGGFIKIVIDQGDDYATDYL